MVLFSPLHYFRVLQSQTISVRSFMLRAKAVHHQDNKVRSSEFSAAANAQLKPQTQRNEARLLRCLNRISYKELRASTVFQPEQVKNIWKHRKNKGHFSSLEQVSIFLNMDVDTVTSLGSSLTSLFEQKRRVEALESFTPLITSQQIKKVNNVVGMEVYNDALCLSLLSREFKALEWEIIPFKTNYKTAKQFQIFEMAHSLAKVIPEADAYVFYHSSRSRSKDINITKLHTFIFQLQMAILCFLNKDFTENEEHKVFRVKKNLVKTMFDLQVGGEGVSGQHMMDNLDDNVITSRVFFTPHLIEAFYGLQTDVEKERYMETFLLTLAFMNVIVPED